MNNTILPPEQEATDKNTSPERLRELAQLNITLARLVAQNPNTPPDVLEQLASSSDEEIRKAVTSNPNTPTKILLKLGTEFPQRLGENPITDFWLLEDDHPFLNEKEFSKKLASNRNTPAKLLAILSKNADSNVRIGVAINPNTPVSLLEILVKDAEYQVRYRVARNSNIPVSVLENLVKDADSDVRLKIARNINTPVSLSKILADELFVKLPKTSTNVKPNNNLTSK